MLSCINDLDSWVFAIFIPVSIILSIKAVICLPHVCFHQVVFKAQDCLLLSVLLISLAVLCKSHSSLLGLRDCSGRSYVDVIISCTFQLHSRRNTTSYFCSSRSFVSPGLWSYTATPYRRTRTVPFALKTMFYVLQAQFAARNSSALDVTMTVRDSLGHSLTCSLQKHTPLKKILLEGQLIGRIGTSTWTILSADVPRRPKRATMFCLVLSLMVCWIACFPLLLVTN